ncbi:MAG: Ig domain-containing protein [Candidatus Korobacteraceae bacterium]
MVPGLAPRAMRSSHISRLFCPCVTLLLIASWAFAAGQTTPPAQQQPLSVNGQALPNGAAGEGYSFQLTASGGTPPVLWQLIQGNLPSGIHLDEVSGLLLGTPRAIGTFRFILGATDSGAPRSVARAEFTLKISPALTIVWSPAPGVQNDTIAGQLAVSSNMNENLDLTVIVVAINESGKAFVLGYQHFALSPRTSNLAIPFASSLPYGSYVVHADAIGEDTNTNSIYRALLDSSGSLTISPP